MLENTVALVRKSIIGAIALFVFVADSVLGQVNDIQVSAVGCGPLFMSNKGRLSSLHTSGEEHR